MLNGYDEITHLYQPDSADPFAGRAFASKDQQIIVRDVSENAHPIITPEIFKKYAAARIQAAISLLAEQRGRATLEGGSAKKSFDQRISELRTLEKVYGHFFDQRFVEEFNQARIERFKAHQIAARVFQAGKIDESTYFRWKAQADKPYHAAFKQLYEHNLAQQRKINALLVANLDPIKGKKNPKKVLKKINNRAHEIRAREARPIQENHYEAEGVAVTSSHIPEGWLTPEQAALYEREYGQKPPEGRPFTLPSTIVDKRQISQRNALRTEIQIDGETVFTGHRHGSPSVLDIDDDAERQYRTLENVKQVMALAAQKQLAAHPDRTIMDGQKILSIDMATMSLLSPSHKGDKFDPDKQYRQVDDARLAYWSLQGRPIPLEIIENGKPRQIFVQLNSTFMSIGVNAVRGAGTPAAKELVQRINHRGMDQFISNMMKDLDKNKEEVDPILMQSIQTLEKAPSIVKIADQIKKFNRGSLQAAYEQLEITNKQIALAKPKDKNAIKSLQLEREKALLRIKKQEKQLDHLYTKLDAAREKVYKPALQKLKDQLNTLHHDSHNNKNYQKIRMFVDSLDIYYQPKQGLMRTGKAWYLNRKKSKILKAFAKSKSPKKREQLAKEAHLLQKELDQLNKSNYRFQARFAMLASHMDTFVEWFCKSGEDRTGLLNEHIEAFCIYIEKYGHAPSWDNEQDKANFHQIMPHVHNGAPNRETNGFNDDSPGLKVSDPDFEMPSVSYVTDKALSNIQSHASKGVKELLPEARDALENAKQEYALTLEKSVVKAEVHPSSRPILSAAERAAAIERHKHKHKPLSIPPTGKPGAAKDSEPRKGHGKPLPPLPKLKPK